jgi:membrane-associated phospholipid phosphatase
MSRIVRNIGDWLPQGWGDAGRQVGLFVVADLCYETVRGLAEGQRTEAFANAATVIDIEKATGTFFEPDLQAALLPYQWIIDLANFSYMNTHFMLTSAFLVWLYLCRNESFYFVRNMFMVAMALALVGYALVPTAPPRLIPDEGFIDTLTAYSQVNHDSALVSIFINPYAAIPSMHCAFALMIGIPGAMIARHRITRAFWCIYPLFVLFVVVVTANHFWLDAAAGALVAAMSALVASEVLGRARPAAWAWRPATA